MLYLVVPSPAVSLLRSCLFASRRQQAEHKCLGGGWTFGRGLAHSKVPRRGAPCTPTWRGSSTTFPRK